MSRALFIRAQIDDGYAANFNYEVYLDERDISGIIAQPAQIGLKVHILLLQLAGLIVTDFIRTWITFYMASTFN